MLNAARHDDEFAGLDPFRLLASRFAIVHPKATLHDQKHLVFIFEMMPGEPPFERDELDELAVEFTRDARIPVVVDERKFFREIDLVHISWSADILSAVREHLARSFIDRQGCR